MTPAPLSVVVRMPLDQHPLPGLVVGLDRYLVLYYDDNDDDDDDDDDDGDGDDDDDDDDDVDDDDDDDDDECIFIPMTILNP